MVLSASAINLKSMTMGVILGNKWQCETYDVDQRRKKKKKTKHKAQRVPMSQILVNVETGSKQNYMALFMYLTFGLMSTCKNSCTSVANMRSCFVFQMQNLLIPRDLNI